MLVTETAKRPAFKVGAGLQGIATGNPGYYASIEKRFHMGKFEVSSYGGIGARANENHVHGLGGVKLIFSGPWRLGIQLDGHEMHPYVTYEGGPWVVGFYWADTKRAGYLAGLRW